MPDKNYQRLLIVLRVALWLAALRHSLTLIRLAWMNAGVLHGFAPKGVKSAGWFGACLPFHRYARLFRPVVMLPATNAAFALRLQRLHRQLNIAFAGHRPAFDPLTGRRACRLQAAIVRSLFWRLFRFRLEPAEKLALSGYGNAGMAARDFLNYASYFGWSSPLTVSFQLFVSEVQIRHDKASGRQGILRTLLSFAGFHQQAGMLHRMAAARLAVEHLLCRVYWAAQDRRERKLRLSAARRIRARESAEFAGPFRRIAIEDQHSLLDVLAHEMLWHAMSQLLDLRAHMPKTAQTSLRFESARIALQKNLASVLPPELDEEQEHAEGVFQLE